MPESAPVAEQAVDAIRALALVGATVVLFLACYLLAVRVLFRVGRADRFAVEARDRCRWPARSTVVLLGVLSSLPFTDIPEVAAGRIAHAATIAVILTGAWTLLRLGVAIEVAVMAGLDVEAEDNAWARGRQTKVILLRRITSALVILGAVGGVLLSFETARTLGTSLLASAGVLGLVVGIAAQPTLGNIVAGIQLAVAEPIRIDDVVVVEGEWGNIEEITLTYVVVRTWDRRRLVMPTSYFVATPFQNWTREGSQVIGGVTWAVDPRVPVQAVREEFHRQVEAHPLWDGDVAVLQVIEADDPVVIRGLVTAKDAGRVWDLRCAVREGVLAWMVETHPEALPTLRVREGAASRPHVPRPDGLPGERSPGPQTEARPDPARTGEWPVVP